MGHVRQHGTPLKKNKAAASYLCVLPYCWHIGTKGCCLEWPDSRDEAMPTIWAPLLPTSVCAVAWDAWGAWNARCRTSHARQWGLYGRASNKDWPRLWFQHNQNQAFRIIADTKYFPTGLLGFACLLHAWWGLSLQQRFASFSYPSIMSRSTGVSLSIRVALAMSSEHRARLETAVTSDHRATLETAVNS